MDPELPADAQASMLKASGAFITLQGAFEQVAEEIKLYHQKHGFPIELTHHRGGDAPRFISLQGYYVDRGNWCGSVLMYTLLFDHGLISIFDQTGERADVYRYWGPEGQKSGKGPDNARTNLLEAILTVMGNEKSQKTQLAWNLTRRYADRHPEMTRQELLESSRHNQSTDLYSDDEAIADRMLAEFQRDYDVDVSVNLAKLFQIVRSKNQTPDYTTICQVTGCSSKNRALRHLYWRASDRYRILYSADSCEHV